MTKFLYNYQQILNYNKNWVSENEWWHMEM